MSRHSVSGGIFPVSRLKSDMKPTNVSRDLRMTTRADSDVQPRCLCVNVLTCRATPPPPEVLIDSNECRSSLQPSVVLHNHTTDHPDGRDDLYNGALCCIPALNICHTHIIQVQDLSALTPHHLWQQGRGRRCQIDPVWSTSCCHGVGFAQCYTHWLSDALGCREQRQTILKAE